MEMVGIREPPGMIPNGIHGIPLQFHWNSTGIPWEQLYSHCQKWYNSQESNTRICDTSHAWTKERSCRYTMWPLKVYLPTSLIPVVAWPCPKRTSAFADVWFGRDQQQTVVVFQPPPSLPSTTRSAARRPQPPPLSSTIELTWPTAHNYPSAHHVQCLDATSPGQPMVTTTCHVAWTVMTCRHCSCRWVHNPPPPTSFFTWEAGATSHDPQRQMTTNRHERVAMTPHDDHTTSHHMSTPRTAMRLHQPTNIAPPHRN